MVSKIIKIILSVVFILIVVCAGFYYSAQTHTVVFIGDSITFYGENTEKGFVTQFRNKFSSKINIISKGVCGEETPDILARLNTDVIDYNPDVMVMMIGINDINNKNITVEELKNNMTEIIDIVKENNIEPLIFNLSFITEDLNNEKNIQIEEYNKFLEKLAKEKQFILIDVHTPLKAEIEKQSNEGLAVMEDDLHLNELGNTILANELIKVFMKKYVLKWLLFN